MSATGRAQAVQRLNAQVESARSWCQRQPLACLALGVVLIAIGAAIVAWAIDSRKLVLLPLGALVAVAGLTALNQLVRDQTDKRPWLWLAIGVVGTLVGVAVIAAAFSADSVALATVGVTIAVVGLLPVSSWLRIVGQEGRAWQAVAGPALIVLGPVTAGLLGLHWAIGGAVSVVGLFFYKIGLRRAAETETGARIESWAGLGATFAGLAALLWASAGHGLLWAVAGTYLLVVGLMAMSVGWPRLGLRPFTPFWARLFGVVIVVLGWWLVVGALNTSPLAALVLSLAFAALGGSFVWRGEALFVAVLIGAALVWLTVDRVDDVPDDPHPQAAERILALGDSYISGEGAPHFFEGTNVRGGERNECRRAPTAYPYLVAEKLGMGLDFFACSGAKADQLHLRGQAPPESPDDIIGEKPQLDNLPADLSRIKVVLVSIGGNDAQFGDIGQGCVLPGTCTALRDSWLANLDQIGSGITDAYEEIKRRLPGVPVVAIPYPLMLTEQGCDGSRLDRVEHGFISEFVTVLNDRVRVAAEKAGVHFFDGEMFAFEGRRICDPGETVMNTIHVNPVHGSMAERINPRNWIHGSLHPRPAGHQATAAVLEPWLRALLAGVRDGTVPVNPPANQGAAFTFRNVGGLTPMLLAEADRPRDLPCMAAGDVVEPFATRVRLFDEESPFPVNAVPDSALCRTRPDGSWESLTPAPDNAEAMVADGVVYVRPIRPASGPSQQVVYKSPGGRWQLRHVVFCSRDDACPNRVNEFVNEQVGRAAKVAVPPILLLVFGGWMFAVGTTRRVVRTRTG